MASFPRPESSDIFNSGLFNIGGESISLEEADRRYLKLGGGFISGNLSISGALITNSLDTLSLTINGTPLDISPISGIVNGVAQANKALIVDSSRNISNINALSCSSLSIGGAPLTPSTLPALSVSGGLDPAGNGVNLSGYVWYANQSRFYGARLIDTNNFCLLNCSGGGIYNDVLVYTHGSSPLLNMAIANGTLRSQIINGTQEIDTPLLDLRSSQPLNTYRTRMRWGGTANDNEAWYLESYTSGINSHFNIKNQTSSLSLLGFSFGCPSGVSNSDGAAFVINGIQGDGNFITTNSSSTNASLHINAGVPQAVPAGRRYGSSSGDPVNVNGGVVSVSLYTHNDIWIRGNMYATSDRRMKTNIRPWKDDNVMNLLKIKPVLYNWKDRSNDEPLLGFIAQDLIKEELNGLVQLFKNEEVKEPCKETGEAAGTQFVVDYSKLPIYLLEIIKDLKRDIDKLKNGSS